MRAVFIGCVEMSAIFLAHLRTLPIEIVGVVTRYNPTFNSDFQSLSGSNVFHADDNSLRSLGGYLASLAPDIVFCCGWSSLLPADVLRIPRLGVIGFHPSLLPMNRGRHPIIWALALGLERTGSTFFLMNEKPDAGPIISQRRIPIGPDDCARDLYERIAKVGCEQLTEIVANKFQGNATLAIPQDDLRASLWRKRSEKDGRIDFRMSAESIRNLVRALSQPYPGAHIETQEGNVKVWMARNGGHSALQAEPGKVLDHALNAVLVQCGDNSVIWLTQHEFEELPAIGIYL